jgi:hypothetical protein
MTTLVDVSAVAFLPGGWLSGYKPCLFSRLRRLGKNCGSWRLARLQLGKFKTQKGVRVFSWNLCKI